MKILCNGEPLVLEQENNLSALMILKGLSEKKGIALAVNNEVIPKNEWSQFALQENDNVLIITAAQGG